MNVATSDDPVYRPIDTVPRGVKCLLLTRYGVAVLGAIGSGKTTEGYVAWSPLPKVPPAIKALM